VSSNSSDAPPVELTAADFVATLEVSGVLSETELREIRRRVTEVGPAVAPDALAGELVENGKLTEFQATRLLHGRTRGLVLGRYVLLDRIGIGAMGRVFKARHQLMDRVVALKVVIPGCVTSRHAVARFFREMKIVGLLDHPNVVRAFDADKYGDSPFMVMEYLDGEDLERCLLRRGALPADDVIGYMAQTAWGLAHAHEKGIVHRDIKPTNLFLIPATGVVKVLDLGLGAFVGVSNEKIRPSDTDEGFVVGTTDYMSPEQVSGEPVDARTDLFSLGCTMYRLLTRTYAFPGITKMDRLVRRISGPHAPINELRRDLHPRLVTTLDRLLSLNPDERYSEAGEVAEALESLLPAADRPSNWNGRVSVAGLTSRTSASSTSTLPEAPLDWSLVDSALRPPPRDKTSPDTRRLMPAAAATAPSAPTRKLDAHRRNLEDDGSESGRTVQQEYRKEVIKLNRELADQQAEASGEQEDSSFAMLMERVGERLGDFLAEPSAGHLIVVAVVATLIVALGLAYALG
jgi:serine/threonine-protein kinase